MSPKKKGPSPTRPTNGAAHNGRHGRLVRSPARSREHESESLRLTELVRDDLVKLPLRATDQWGAVEELIRLMVSRQEVPASLASAALAAVREREAIRPTGWKYGLALPNGRVPGLKRVVVAIGVSVPGIDFVCRDRLPARIIVMILLPEACYSRFAPGLDTIAETFEDPVFRETVLAARSAAEVVEAVEDAESRILA